MEQVMVVALAVVLLTAVCTDLFSSRIPNSVTFLSIGIALLTHTWLGDLPGLIFCVSGLVVGLGLFLLPYLSGGIGAGDVKLMAAVGAFIGPYGAFSSGIMAMIIGGAYAVGAMCYQSGLFTTGRNLAAVVHGAVLTGGRPPSRDLAVPIRLRYALAIAGGTLLFLTGIRPFE